MRLKTFLARLLVKTKRKNPSQTPNAKRYRESCAVSNVSFVPRVKHLALLIAGAVLVSIFSYGEGSAQTRTERFFDDWRGLCVESAEGPKRCSMSQTLVLNNPRREVFRWTILPAENNELTNVLSAPLGVSLRPGLELSLPETEPISVPYNVCGSRWCQANLPMSDEIRNRMANGESVKVVYVNRRGQRLRFEVTVRGFAEALNYLQNQAGN